MKKRSDLKHFSLILKTVERCNINCTYCYFFHGKDQSYADRKPYINRSTIDSIITFLSNGIDELDLESMSIGFHGGEPLMQKIPDFRYACEQFIQKLKPKLNTLSFNMQTNGMLLNEEWIDALTDYDVKIGVSIDGTEEIHDKHRLDLKGKGTYERVKERVHFALNHEKIIKAGGIGCLSVINPSCNGRLIYRHLIDEFQFKKIDFLLPDFNHDDELPYPQDMYGQFLCDVFDEWTKDDDPTIRVRLLESTLNLFLGDGSLIYGIGPSESDHLPLIAIRNNGDLSPTDELMTTDASITQTGYNVNNIKLSEFLKIPLFKQIDIAQNTSPDNCKKCCWENICGGGGIVNRYSSKNQFDNPSLYCGGLYNFYAHVTNYLLQAGYPLNKIGDRLFNLEHA